jgi:hypothetical protein
MNTKIEAAKKALLALTPGGMFANGLSTAPKLAINVGSV